MPEPSKSPITAPRTYRFKGKCSHFGGPNDTGVTPSEGLALVAPGEQGAAKFAGLFLPDQPPRTTGLARRLNPDALYCAMRWAYEKPAGGMPVTSRELLRNHAVSVTFNGRTVHGVRPVDWGPNVRTGRIIDLSPGVCAALGCKTDDVVEVEITL